MTIGQFSNHVSVLNDDALYRAAPSIFAMQPYERMSARYNFVPTIGVIDNMRRNGFYPVSAQQSVARIFERKALTKHIVRFIHDDLIGQDLKEYPEIVLVNSHDGTTSYQLFAGIFRMVCCNGIISCSSNFGSIKVKHYGNQAAKIVEGSHSIMDNMPKITQRITQFKATELEPRDKIFLALNAQEARYGLDGHGVPAAPYKPHHLLKNRHPNDTSNPNSLWTVFNNIQEGIIKGGIKYTRPPQFNYNDDGSFKEFIPMRHQTTKAIKSVGSDVKLNSRLWELADAMADSKCTY